MAKVSDAAAQLEALTQQVDRNRQEVLDKIAALEDAAGDETTPEFDQALENLKQAVQRADDDVVPSGGSDGGQPG